MSNKFEIIVESRNTPPSRPRPGSRRHEGGGGRLPPDEEATRGSHRRPMGQAARQQLNTAKSPNWRPKNPIYLEQPDCFEQHL
jgi:hypothetical protein